MRRVIAIIICLGLLGFGLIRIGVGGALLAQLFGFINFDQFVEPITEIDNFLVEKESLQLIAFSVQSYVMYIVAMGVALSLGAIGAIFRKGWGMSLIGFYLAMHAALFVNFQTINPKIIFLGVGIVLYLILFWANQKEAT